MINKFLTKYYTDEGLLLLRIGIGIMFIYHGWPKISGGPEFWGKLGGATTFIGINFAPTFFGFMSASAEFFGGIAVILGLLFRPACAVLVVNMWVATAMHLGK